MSNVRIAALVIVVLMASLSIPHVSLLNFGVESGNAATCGNNILEEPDESCDGDKFPPDVDCTRFTIPGTTDKYTGGTLKCIDCQGYDKSSCISTPTMNIQFYLDTTIGKTTTTIRPGETISLSWSVSGGAAANVIISGQGLSSGTGPYGLTYSNLYASPTSTSSYILTVRDSKNAALGSAKVDVTVTGSAGNSRQCCVISEPDNRATYSSELTRDQCKDKNGRYVESSCSTVETQQCSQFCLGLNPPRAPGTCNAGAPDPLLYRYDRVCASGVCQCGQINQQAQRTREACSSACLTSNGPYGYGSSFSGVYTPTFSAQSYSQLPIGKCTNNPQTLYLLYNIETSAGVSGGSATRQPYRVGNRGENQCSPDEECWCIYLNINSLSADTPKPQLPATIPGTQGSRWTPPNKVDNPPQKQPNERKCDVAVNATMTASFGTVSVGNGTTGTATIGNLKLIQSGEPVTIIGKVTKLTDKCAGYTYTCQVMKDLECKISTRWDHLGATTKLEYKACPAGTERFHAEGEGTHANIRAITGMVEIVGGVVAVFIPGGQAIGITAIEAGVSTYIDGVTVNCETGRSTFNAAALYAMMETAHREIDRNNNRNNNPANLPAGQPAGNNPNNNPNNNPGGTPLPCEKDLDCPSNMACNNAQCTVGPRPGNTPTLPNGVIPTSSECRAIGGTCDLIGTCFSPDVIYTAESFTCPDGTYCCGPRRSPSGAASANPTFDLTGRAAGQGITGEAGGYVVNVADSGGNIVGTTTVGSSAAPAASSAASGAAMAGAGAIATQIGHQLPACPSQEDVDKCFSVCGVKADTKVSYAPTCADTVVDYKDAEYACGMGDCGGFDGKAVRIQIIGPSGATVIDDSVAADADGAFSYTFRAPAGDGEFTAVVSVDQG